MKEQVFEEMLKEIDTMSPEEYWSLYCEADSRIPDENEAVFLEEENTFDFSQLKD